MNWIHYFDRRLCIQFEHHLDVAALTICARATAWGKCKDNGESFISTVNNPGSSLENHEVQALVPMFFPPLQVTHLSRKHPWWYFYPISQNAADLRKNPFRGIQGCCFSAPCSAWQRSCYRLTLCLRHWISGVDEWAFNGEGIKWMRDGR